MKRIILTLLASGSLLGCATGPTNKVELKSNFFVADTSALIATQARTCWTKKVDPLRKGIRVLAQGDPNFDASFSAFKIEWAGPQPKEPFIKVRVIPDGSGSNVEVTEGDFACGIAQGCVNLGLTEEILKWIGGDKSCKSLDKMLLLLGTGF